MKYHLNLLIIFHFIKDKTGGTFKHAEYSGVVFQNIVKDYIAEQNKEILEAKIVSDIPALKKYKNNIDVIKSLQEDLVMELKTIPATMNT